MALPAHRLWWPATLTAPARSTAVLAHRSSRSAAPTAGWHGGGGEPLRAAERFARRVHGDDDTAAGAKAEIPAFPRRGSRVVPPWRRWRPRLLRALHQARRKPWRRGARPTDAGREHVSRRVDARAERRHPHERQRQRRAGGKL